jgi:hypothetical protein
MRVRSRETDVCSFQAGDDSASAPWSQPLIFFVWLGNPRPFLTPPVEPCA